jgi:hypothetical protein
MTKLKTSVTLDEDKIHEVRRIAGATTTSAAIDFALSKVIALERARKDVAAYRQTPTTDDEVALARISHDWSDLTDDTDWEALYADAPQ